MRSVFQLLPHHGTHTSSLTLPVAYITLLALSASQRPSIHSLAINCTAWTLLCIYTSLGVGLKVAFRNAPRRKHCWAAGALLGLSQVCERAMRDREGILWSKALLPITVYAVLQTDLAGHSDSHPLRPSSAGDTEPPSRTEGNSLIIIITATAGAVLYVYSSPSTFSLALSVALFTAGALILLESGLTTSPEEAYAGNGGYVSANGSFSRNSSTGQEEVDAYAASASAFCMAAAVACAIGTAMIEGFPRPSVTHGNTIQQAFGAKIGAGTLELVLTLCAIALRTLVGLVLLTTIRRYGSLRVSFLVLAAALTADLAATFSVSSLWFSTICALASYLFFNDSVASAQIPIASKGAMRVRQLLALVVVLSLAFFTILSLRQPFHRSTHRTSNTAIATQAPEKPLEPLHIASTRSHPIDQLVKDAETQFQKTLDAQSQTLDQAVVEYKRRYGLNPPPNFDKWFEFAKRKGVKLIDEYDTIHHALLPFWGLDPATIRARVREALGFADNALIGLMVRDGQMKRIEGGSEWQQKATTGMMEGFFQYLPDMDLAFNIHDEPRVIVPHDDLARLVNIAKDVKMPAAGAKSSPKNSFSPRPKDVSNGVRIAEVKNTRFNQFAHQPTWTNSKLSCGPDTPARALGEIIHDNVTSYALSDLGFVYNQTAFTDICMSPSLRESFGFFDRPNAFNIVHELFPIFSQSKISSFQDILYPSPWYWYEKVKYESKKDMDWAKKDSKLYWRGSTTGGFSRRGGWRRQHRQHMVQKFNAPDTATILRDAGSENQPNWQLKDVSRRDYKDLIDVRFSHVGQCDPGDCDAQKEFFDIAPPADFQDAWASKFLLDVDGNAFSGRFYAFLKSKSLTFKMAIFQEWHMEWLKPWVHFIPLSLKGDEWLEAVRYFSGEQEGKRLAVRIAERSSDWDGKALRNVDLEAWFFRLLLEYGRVIDDDRENIGYA